jgi:dethiobiotin synthetase
VSAQGIFVTGTDTGAGKTFVSAAIAAGLESRSLTVGVRKPLLTGLDEPDSSVPMDHELLAFASGTGESPLAVAPLRFGPAVSPHLAASMAGVEIDFEAITEDIEAARESCDVLIVEGVGGLLVPIGGGRSIRDLAARLAFPLVVAARPGLGTINHCALTVEAARSAGLDPRLIVFGPWPQHPGPIELDNFETVARISGVETATIPYLDPADRAAMAAAGANLPLDLLIAA